MPLNNPKAYMKGKKPKVKGKATRKAKPKTPKKGAKRDLNMIANNAAKSISSADGGDAQSTKQRYIDKAMGGPARPF